jgi:hypothetical protein
MIEIKKIALLRINGPLSNSLTTNNIKSNPIMSKAITMPLFFHSCVIKIDLDTTETTYCNYFHSTCDSFKRKALIKYRK